MRNRQKPELVALVCDLAALGYGASSIGRALQRSPERIRQIMRDASITKPRIRTVDDLPPDLRQRVLAFRNLRNAT